MAAASGSATDQPVSAMVAPAASTAPDERVAEHLQIRGADVQALVRAPACSSQREARLTPSPSAAATMSGNAGAIRRRPQAMPGVPEYAQRDDAEDDAVDEGGEDLDSIVPVGFRAVAGRSANQMAARLRRMPPASTSMCTASAMSDTLPVRTASASSTTQEAAHQRQRGASRPLWREPWECRCTGRSAGEGGWEHEPGLALSHPLALEEALARLQREAEVAQWARRARWRWVPCAGWRRCARRP